VRKTAAVVGVVMLSAGCPATATVTDHESFGPVRSALDLHLAWTVGGEPGPAFDFLLYSSVGDYCSVLTEAAVDGQARWEQLIRDLEAAAETTEACNRWEGFWWGLETDSRDALDEGDRLGWFRRLERIGEFDQGHPPERGVYPLGDPSAGQWVDGRVEWIEADPYEVARATLDCPGDDVFTAPFEGWWRIRDTLRLTDGEVVLDDGDDGWEVSVEAATLVDEEEAAAGAFEFEGTFTPCRIDLEAEQYRFFLLFSD